MWGSRGTGVAQVCRGRTLRTFACNVYLRLTFSCSLLCPLDHLASKGDDSSSSSGDGDGDDSTNGSQQLDGLGNTTALDLRYLPVGLRSLRVEAAHLTIAGATQEGDCQRTAQRRLPNLVSLEVDSCRLGDACLHSLLHPDCSSRGVTGPSAAASSPTIQRLELSSVRGLSAAGLMAALKGLPRLHTLILNDVLPEEDKRAGEGREGSLTSAAAFLGWRRTGGGGAVANAARAALRVEDEAPAVQCLRQLPETLSASTSSLRHLEWAPGVKELSGRQLSLYAPSAFEPFTALRFLYVLGEHSCEDESDDDGRKGESESGEVPRPAAGSTFGWLLGISTSVAGETSAAGPDAIGGSESMALADSWERRVRPHLPLCYVTTKASRCMAEYDVHDDGVTVFD